MDNFYSIGMPGRWYEELFEVAVGQYGYVTSADVRDLGGYGGVLVDMERAGHLERVARGLYRFVSYPVDPRDELMAATLWSRSAGIISHDSALDLWDLCDVNPAKVHVTVARSARIRRTIPAAYQIHVRDLAPCEVGNVDGIPTVTAMRAILDGIERHLDRRLIKQAIDSATSRGLLLGSEHQALLEAAK